MSAPAITVIGGNPTADELAALLAVLLGTPAAAPATPADTVAPRRPRWTASPYLAPHSWHLPRPVTIH